MISFHFFWLFYILLVAYPTVIGVKKKGKWTGDDIAYICTLFLILIIPFVIKYIDLGIKGDYINASVVYSAALSIVCVYFKSIINTRKEYREIKGKLDSQMENFINHPVLNSKENIDGVISSMFELSHSRNIVLDFFANSFRTIKIKGAVRIDAHLTDYTVLLKELMENAESIIGTFTKRPLYFMDKKDKNTQAYLEILNRKKNSIKRVCVFEQDEIASMEKGEKRVTKKHQDSEVDWFNNHVKASKTKWTETEVFREELRTCGYCGGALPSEYDKMIDFAIFDDILLRWNAADDAKYGAIVMLIGDEAVRLREAMEKYMDNSIYGYETFDDLVRGLDIK